MIKFFRHIRKSLLMENKTGKYFKYAIGEIVLVVIGILIALSINNWNEQKKVNKHEINLLVELQKTIYDEMGKMNNRIIEHEKSRSSCNILVKVLEEKKPYHDSIASHFNKAFTIWDVNIRYSAFENVKSNGLLFIKDEEARYILLEAYEVQIKFLETLMDRYDMYYNNIIAPELAENFEYVEIDWDNDTEGNIPFNYPNNSNNRKHINMLKKTSDFLIQILNTQDRILTIFKKLDEKLTIEIASRQ